MSKATSGRVYPSEPLEEVVVHNEQQQKLLPPTAPPAARQAPPTYDQATTDAGSVPSTGAAGEHHVVVITQPSSVAYGPHPVDVQCPFCHNYTRTQVRHRPNGKTHLFAMLLCLLQLYCCCWIPYCIKSCLSTNHYCGMCNQYLGTYHRG